MRFIFLSLFFLSTLFANTNIEIIEDIQISLDGKMYQAFDKFDEKNLETKFFMKIVLNKKALEKEQFYLRVLHGFDALKSVNTTAKKEDNATLIILDKNSPKELTLFFESKFSDLVLDILLHEKEGFYDLEKKEFLFYGLSYGIIFCAFLYNFVLFLYNHSKTFSKTHYSNVRKL